MRAEATLETTFVPSVHGMPFPNTWETILFDADVAGRQVKLALRGFCGGMSFLALDLHRAGLEAPGEPVGELPERRSPLARYIWRRQVDSLADGLAQNMRGFVKLSYSPRTGPIGSATRTRTRELGNVLVALTAKRPVPLGLIAPNPLRGIGLNHQVVAYGAERSADGLLIGVYDPNIPRRDDVTLFVTWSGDASIVERRGEQQIAEWRALFVERYTPLEPEIG